MGKTRGIRRTNNKFQLVPLPTYGLYGISARSDYGPKSPIGEVVLATLATSGGVMCHLGKGKCICEMRERGFTHLAKMSIDPQV